jgi:nicotinamide-nucleotide amidase
MKIEILNTGAELLQGRRLNTHVVWLGRRLVEMGHDVVRQVTVSDTGVMIEEAVREALGRVDGVIVTGGLGPTSDDLTREHVARLLGRPLREDAGIRAKLGEFYASRGRAVPERVWVQAMVPEGAVVMENRNGTAPGLIFPGEGGRGWLAMLPGPPRELQPMFLEQLMPWMEREYSRGGGYCCVNLRCVGMGESQVEERVEGGLAGCIGRGLEVAYCARPGEVDVRLSARGAGAGAVVAEAVDVVRREVGLCLYAEGEEELESVVIDLLRRGGRTVAVAESCTGGHLADRLTDVPGASECFFGGWVTYSNAAKVRDLGVAEALLLEHGAVSEMVARAMAEGARLRSGADYALAVTGIAGPGGGSEAKPVGTVYMALAKEGETQVVRRHNPWDRRTFKQATSQQALDLLRLALLGEGLGMGR